MKNSNCFKLGIASLFLGGCTSFSDRQPNALNLAEKFEDHTMRAVSEIFTPSVSTAPYRRDMQFEIRVRGDQKYLSENAKKAIQTALSETLESQAPAADLAKTFTSSLKDQVLERFIKTLRVYKLINVGVQVDLKFIPEPNDNISFAPELSSNHLINHSMIGQTNKQLINLSQKDSIQNIYNNSPLVEQTKEFEYIGGIVTLYAEILDSTPKLGLPNPLKNGVKGFVRYRRYVRSNKPTLNNWNCSEFKLTGTAAAASVPFFSTVDVYKNFNLKNLIPTPETVEVFPGRLVSTQNGRNELLADSAKNEIKTYDFKVSNLKSSQIEINMNLRKIVYSIAERRWVSDGSEFSINSINHRLKTGDGEIDNESVLNQQARLFVNKCGPQITKALNYQLMGIGE